MNHHKNTIIMLISILNELEKCKIQSPRILHLHYVRITEENENLVYLANNARLTILVV